MHDRAASRQAGASTRAEGRVCEEIPSRYRPHHVTTYSSDTNLAPSASLSFDEFTNISLVRFVFAMAQLNLFVFKFHTGGDAVFRRDGEAYVFSAWQD